MTSVCHDGAREQKFLEGVCVYTFEMDELLLLFLNRRVGTTNITQEKVDGLEKNGEIMYHEFYVTGQCASPPVYQRCD